MKKDRELDDIDKNILKILQEDARKSYREIKNELGISIGTIHNRISKLKDKDIIEGYTLKLNNVKLGYKLTFLIQVQIDGKHTGEILDEISKRPEVCSVFHTTGEQSAALICRFRESDDVHNFVRELNAKQFILRTNSSLVLKEYKNSAYVELI
jgi:Lrp/AsnC family transcriptional regulator for asnA, asnC and gidA